MDSGRETFSSEFWFLVSPGKAVSRHGQNRVGLERTKGPLSVPFRVEIWWASLVAQMVKNLPANAGDPVWSLGWEDPLEKEMATHSSILAWKIPWTEEPGGLQSMGSWESDTTKQLTRSLSVPLEATGKESDSPHSPPPRTPAALAEPKPPAQPPGGSPTLAKAAPISPPHSWEIQ